MNFIVELVINVIFEGLILKFFKALGYGFHWILLTLSFYSKDQKYRIIKEDQKYHLAIGFIVFIVALALIIFLYK